MGNDTRPNLSANSLVPLGAALAVTLAVVGGTWTVSSALASIDRRLERMEMDRWSASDMERWAHRLERENHDGGLKVPDPSVIKGAAQ